MPSPRPILLDDAKMRSFVSDGYVTLKTDFSRELHEAVGARIEALFENGGNPGNNLLPHVPEIQDVFDHPAVHGALTSLLGPGYYLHPHRHCHYNPPGSPGQRNHKDSWSKYHHRPRWAMGFYYPQDTPVELGPTGVTPGSHYYNGSAGPNQEIPLTGEAGTVILVHYDLWHRGTANTSDKKRYMVKFLFTRLEEPDGPVWDTKNSGWTDDDDLMGASVWRWYTGQHDATDGYHGNEDVANLLNTLRGDDETAALRAAYALAAMGDVVLPGLLTVLGDPSPSARRNAGYALAAIGASAVPGLIDVCTDAPEEVRASALDTLSDMGREAREALPVIVRHLGDLSEKVRRAAADAAGTVGVEKSGSGVVAALIERLGDEDEWVRRNTALALCRIGSKAEEATPALIAALRDPCRYVRYKAAKTLERIGTPQALTALLSFYEMSLWCPVTHRESAY
ncbi:MAG: HEAT repeat domain-containing protein [candidate division Zixibacteria bacterium]|nr:HEAT repeat domain-containing protein [candidate division Zixibacteria bacterium]